MTYEPKPRTEFYIVDDIPLVVMEVTTELENPVTFQCSMCDKRFNALDGLIDHAKAGCPALYPVDGKPRERSVITL